jgi:hypothetical protein
MTERQNGTAQAGSSVHGTAGKALEDTAMRSLSKDEIKRMSIDAWEPSLLRNMLEAEDKLRQR